MASLLGMPPAGQDYPAIVTFSNRGDAEVLTRRYGDNRLETVQKQGVGKESVYLVEKFGPVGLLLKLHGNETGIRFEIVRVRVFGIPLARCIWPTLDAHEWVEEDWYRFSVEIGLPVVGRIVRYEGRLQIDEEAAIS